MTTNFERGFNDTIAVGGGLAGAGIGAAAGGLLGLLTDRKNRLRGALAGLLGGGAIGYGLGAHTNYLANKIEADKQSREKQEQIARQAQIDAARAARTKRIDEISARLTAAGISPRWYAPHGDANDYEVDSYANDANDLLAEQSSKMLSIPFGQFHGFNQENLDLLFAAHPELEKPYRAADARLRELSADSSRRREARKETVRAALIAKYKKELAEHQANRPTDLSGKVPLSSGGHWPAEFRFTPGGGIEVRYPNSSTTRDGNMTYEWKDWRPVGDYDSIYANDELRSWLDKNKDLSEWASGDLWGHDFYSHDADEYDPNSKDYWSHSNDYVNFIRTPLSAFVE